MKGKKVEVPKTAGPIPDGWTPDTRFIEYDYQQPSTGGPDSQRDQAQSSSDTPSNPDSTQFKKY